MSQTLAKQDTNGEGRGKSYRDSLYRQQLRDSLDEHMHKLEQQFYCSSSFSESCVPPLLWQAASMLAGACSINRDRALFSLCFALAGADHGRHMVQADDDKPEALALYGALSLDACAGELDALQDIRNIFLQYESGLRRQSHPIGEGAAWGSGPLLYNDLTHAACAYSLEKNGAYLSFDPEVYDLSPQLFQLLASAWLGEEDEGAPRGACTLLLRLSRRSISAFIQGDTPEAGPMLDKTLFLVPPAGASRNMVLGADEFAWKKLERKITTLLEAASADKPQLLHLDEQAAFAWQSYRRLKQVSLDSMGDDFNRWRAHTPSQVLRLAALFQLIEEHPDGTGLVTVRNLDRAIAFMQVLEEHAYGVFTSHSQERPFECAQAIITYLGKRNIPFCSRPQMLRKLVPLGYETSDILSALGLLEQARPLSRSKSGHAART